MKLIYLLRLALVLLITIAGAGICTGFTDLINNPTFPGEACFAAAGILLIWAGLFAIFYELATRWLKGTHATDTP